jgi:hypothetical protein
VHALGGRVLALAKVIPDHLQAVRTEADGAGLRHPLIDKLASVLAKRAERCVSALEASPLARV